MKSAKITSLISYFNIAFYIVTGLFYTPLLVKTLGLSDYAIFSLVVSLVGYFSIDFGVGAAQTRYIAKLLAEGRRQKIYDLLGITNKIFSLIDFIIIIILIIVYLYADKIFTGFTPEEFIRFREVFIITAVFVMINVPLLPTNGIIIGFDRAYELALINTSYRVASMTFLFIALLINLGLLWIVIINVGCQLLAQIYKMVFIVNKENLKINLNAHDKEILTYLSNFSMWATLGVIADKFFFGIIPFLLAIVSNSNEIAIFAIVISIEGYTLSVSKALNGIFLPRIAKMVTDNTPQIEITKLMIRVGRIQLYVVGLIIFGVVYFGKDFLYLWLGDGFEKSYYCLILVLTPCLFHLTQTIAEETLLATNNIKYRALANCIGSVLSVVSIFLLGREIGALAAGLGVFLSFVLAHNVLIDFFYHRKLGISIIAFLKECQLKIIPIFCISGIAVLGIHWFIPTTNIVSFITKISIWSIITVILLWILAFSVEEKHLIKSFFKIK